MSIASKTDQENIQSGITQLSRWTVIEWISTLAVFIGCFAYLAHKIDRQSERTDKLYEMYVESNREINQKWADCKKELSDYRKESDQKFYDMLKELKK